MRQISKAQLSKAQLSKARISKSRFGLPAPNTSRAVDLRAEARRSRHRLYPVTIAYSGLSLFIMGLAVLRGSRPRWLLSSYPTGVIAWTYAEYLIHRHVLHGVFPDGPGLWRQVLHRAFDHLHFEHHARPFDGNHINGTIRDTSAIVAVVISLSFLAPIQTLPVFLAGLIQAYVLEEWIHHSVHFYDFRNRYFRRIRRHHFYHHSPSGSTVGYGLSNDLWDIVHRTSIPRPAQPRIHNL